MSANSSRYHDLSFDDCMKVIDRFVQADIPEVTITGGEPLIRKDFWQIIDALQSHGIAVPKLFTNGLLVNDGFLQECRRRKLNWAFHISFDGVDCHDWMRGLRGIEASTIDAIRRIKAAGFEVNVKTTLNTDSLGHLIDTYRLLKDLGVGYWKVSQALPKGNWEGHAEDKSVQLEALYAAYLDLIRAYRTDGMPLTLHIAGFFTNFKGASEWRSEYENFNGSQDALNVPLCLKCWGRLYLSVDAKPLPCMALCDACLEDSTPSLLDAPLAECLASSEVFSLMNLRLKQIHDRNPDCASCRFNLRCGPCRALALAESGSLFAPDQGACTFWKQDYPKRIKEVIEEVA
jgi:MoaA/NifB/PqqE/SkfB family radical SAM enzyme